MGKVVHPYDVVPGKGYTAQEIIDRASPDFGEGSVNGDGFAEYVNMTLNQLRNILGGSADKLYELTSDEDLHNEWSEFGQHTRSGGTANKPYERIFTAYHSIGQYAGYDGSADTPGIYPRDDSNGDHVYVKQFCSGDPMSYYTHIDVKIGQVEYPYLDTDGHAQVYMSNSSLDNIDLPWSTFLKGTHGYYVENKKITFEWNGISDSQTIKATMLLKFYSDPDDEDPYTISGSKTFTLTVTFTNQQPTFAYELDADYGNIHYDSEEFTCSTSYLKITNIRMDTGSSGSDVYYRREDANGDTDMESWEVIECDVSIPGENDLGDGYEIATTLSSPPTSDYTVITIKITDSDQHCGDD